MIDCKKCVHYELCLDFVCSKQDMERDTDCDYFEEERPHGEWIDAIYDVATCSECSYIGGNFHRFNFCPNCGADMRKEGETNE